MLVALSPLKKKTLNETYTKKHYNQTIKSTDKKKKKKLVTYKESQ